MSQDVKLGGAAVQVCQTHVIVIVVGGKAQLACQSQSLLQRGLGARAKGSARLGGALHALHRHQAGDGANEPGADGAVRKILVDPLFFHG